MTEQDIVERLTAVDKRALFTRTGRGEFSSACFRRLLALGLVDDAFYWTDLGLSVRALLEKQNG